MNQMLCVKTITCRASLSWNQAIDDVLQTLVVETSNRVVEHQRRGASSQRSFGNEVRKRNDLLFAFRQDRAEPVVWRQTLSSSRPASAAWKIKRNGRCT